MNLIRWEYKVFFLTMSSYDKFSRKVYLLSFIIILSKIYIFLVDCVNFFIDSR